MLILLLNPQAGSGTQTLSAGLLVNANAFYPLTVTSDVATLLPALYSNASSFYAAAVTQVSGVQTLTPARYDNSQGYYSHSLTTSVTLSFARADNSSIVFNPTVTAGAVALNTTRVDNASSIYSFALTSGAANLNVVRLDNVNSFFSAALTTSAVFLNPALLNNPNNFYNFSITAGAVGLSFTRLNNLSNFYLANIQPGVITLQPAVYTNSNSFSSAALVVGPVGLFPGILTNTNAVFVSALSVSGVFLTAARFNNTSVVTVPTVVNIPPPTILSVLRFTNVSRFPRTRVVNEGSNVCGTGSNNGPFPGDPDNNSVLSATSAFGGIDVSWTYPLSNPEAVAHVLLYRNTSPTLGGAIQRAVVSGNFFYDKLNVDATYYYWISIVSINGTVGAPIGPASAQANPLIAELIEELTGEIDRNVLASSLRTELNGINTLSVNLSNEIFNREASLTSFAEALDAIDESVGVVTSSVNTEIANRVTATQALATGLDQAATSLLNESAARASAISAVNTAIRADLATADNAVVSSLTTAYTAADAATLASAQDYTYSKATITSSIAASGSQLQTQFAAADLAILSEAQNFTYSRTSIDASTTATLATLRAEFAAADSTTLSDAKSYTYSQADINSAITTSANTLRSQITGGSTATDIDTLSSGLLYQERITRAAMDASLSQQITLLSAGAGDQFDYQILWPFDLTTEGWGVNNSANTEIVAVNGWLKLAATSGTQSVRLFESPLSLGVDGSKYSQVRLRIRKVGTPTWVGRLYFTTNADLFWDTAKSVVIGEPTFGANNIALLTFDMPANWTGQTIYRLRFEASTNVTTTNYFELDWVAVGRPSPGASSAQLTAEQLARANGDNAEAIARESLASQMRGTYTGTDVALLNSGLLYNERVARSTADSTEVAQRQLLSTKITGQDNPADLTLGTLASGLLFDERTARITADNAEASSRDSLAVQLRGNYTGTNANSVVTGLIASERDLRATAVASEASSRNTLQTKLIGNSDPAVIQLAGLSSGLIFDERTARSTADSTEVTAREALSTTLAGSPTPGSLTLATLSSGLLFQEREARATADSALSSQITQAQTTLNGNIATAQTTLQTNITTVDSKVTAIGARYTVNVNANDLVGGFGIYNDGSTIQAGFDVDEFWVGKTQANKRKPFIIQGNVTYIDQSVINELTFTKLKDAGGSFIVADGKVKADYLNIKGLTVTNNLGGNTFVVDSNGNVTMSGVLSGASGTFSGTLTAANVVTTSNININAVTAALHDYVDAAITISGNVINSANFISSGGPIWVHASFSVFTVPMGRYNAGEIDVVYQVPFLIKLFRGGSVIATRQSVGGGMVSFSYIDTPGVGTHPYAVTVEMTDGVEVAGVVGHRFLGLLETKR
jgi:hypothetical protein